MGEETVGPSGSKKTGERKHRDLRLLLLGKLCFNTRKAFTAWLRKNRLDPGTGLVNPGATAIRLPPTPTAAGTAGRWVPWPTPGSLGRLGWWGRSSGPADSTMIVSGH